MSVLKIIIFVSFIILYSGCSFKTTLIKVPQTFNSTFDETLIKVSQIDDSIINREFSNIEDLEFLKSIASNNKVVLLGENHYFQSIQSLRDRILFALNTFDRFHLISLERQYSVTPFFNHYVSLSNKTEADLFYKNQMHNMVNDYSLKELLEKIRIWNIKNPQKKISVSGHDIEHDYKTTIKDILLPYFKELDATLTFSVKNYSELEINITTFNKLLLEAKNKNLIGSYSFITPEYIETVIQNLESTYLAKTKSFNLYRQRAIIRNLTDVRYLGSYIDSGKIMIHAGGYHTRTKFKNPKFNEKYYSEGNYLNNFYPKTKGKCYSILAMGLSYNFSNVINIKEEDFLHSGRGYKNLINSFKNLYDSSKEVGIANEYFFPKYSSNQILLNSLISYLFRQGNIRKINIFKIDYLNKEQILKKAEKNEFNIITDYIEDTENNDLMIFILRSKIIDIIKKDPR